MIWRRCSLLPKTSTPTWGASRRPTNLRIRCTVTRMTSRSPKAITWNRGQRALICGRIRRGRGFTACCRRRLVVDAAIRGRPHQCTVGLYLGPMSMAGPHQSTGGWDCSSFRRGHDRNAGRPRCLSDIGHRMTFGCGERASPGIAESSSLQPLV